MKLQTVSLIAWNIKQYLQHEDNVNAAKLYFNARRATDKINQFLDKEEIRLLNNLLNKENK